MRYQGNFCFIIAVLLYCNPCSSQIFGGNPPSLKWKQINTPSSRIIFPKGLDSIAERVTNIINFINGPTLQTIGRHTKKINLVIQNQTTVSNAYVGLAPFRSEFLITPLQNSFELGSLPWPDQLAIHEYRHVQQYNNFNVGISRVLHDIFGEEGQALANNAAIPNWFYEGDAVFNETNLSRQGRGSLPFFYNAYRSLWKDGKQYSWMKLRNGSYKDFVPNHYELGFLLVAYGREKYGDLFWEKVTHDAASFKGLFYPFQRAVKKYSGKSYVSFRNDAIDFFKIQFNLENADSISQVKSHVDTDEQFPTYIGNDSIVFVKSGFKNVPQFVLRVGGKDTKLRIKDFSNDNQFSYQNGKIVYASYRPDARWGYRDYSEICIFNITNGKQQTITHRTKLFSPDISKDGLKIIAVDEAVNTKCHLNLLDAATGKIVKVIPNPGQLFYTYPKFYSNEIIASAVRDPSGKMSLALINANNGRAQFLTPFSYNVIGFPFIQNDTIYFSFSYKKNDELFCYTMGDKKLWKVNYKKQNGLGKYQVSSIGTQITWSTFTAEGYILKQVNKDELEFAEMNPDFMDKNTSSFGISALQNTNANLLYGVPKDSFKVSKYSKGYKFLNFHSIEPAANDPEYTLNLLGENILNTLQSQLSFTYDRAEKFKRIGFTSTYSALFPFLSAGINYTIDRRTLYHDNAVLFNELEPFVGFSIPLNLSKGRYFTFLNFGSQYVYNESDFRGAYKDTLGKISYGYLSNSLSFSHQTQQTIQQIFPQFAQSISATYQSALSHYKGFQFVLNGNLYFPGFIKNHSIVLNGAYLKKDSIGELSFTSGFPFSRGYTALNLYQMYKWGINYHLPLLYPDAGFGDIFYLLTVSGNVFYDNTSANDFYENGAKFHAKFRSTGAEINFDTKWWNEANISFGIRYSRLLDQDLFGGSGRNRWEIILPVNIFNQ
jgi:hypothetical protein